MSDDVIYLNGTDPPCTANKSPPIPAATPAGDSWDELSNALTPFIGQAGVTAIYLRALQCAETEYPWLDAVREQTLPANRFTPLLTRLSLCTAANAASAQACLLEHFDRQLTALIGEPLTQRLLAIGRTMDEGAGDAPSLPRHDQIGERLTLTALRAEADARCARSERDDALRASELDDLTGTKNRTLMLDRLRSAIALADRTGTPTAVLFIDIDNFKQINDRMGHRAGDDMLCAIAIRLQEAVRKTDTVCRYGGDEFVVILSPMERRTEAAPAVARLLLAIGEVRGSNSAAPALSASIGIALYPEHGTDPAALLERADRSMYRHKRGQPDPLPHTQEGHPRAGSDSSDSAVRPEVEVPRVHEPLTGSRSDSA